MKDKIKNMALENFRNGASCSESIVKVFSDLGLIHNSLYIASTVFSAGLSSGCLCGAIAGAEIILGAIYEKESRAYAKKFIEEFIKLNGATCCRILTKGYDFKSADRKIHCEDMVSSATSILYNLIEDKIKTVVKI